MNNVQKSIFLKKTRGKRKKTQKQFLTEKMMKMKKEKNEKKSPQ